MREFRRRQKLSGGGSRELSADQFPDLMEDQMHRWRHAEMERLHRRWRRESPKSLSEFVTLRGATKGSLAI